ncbi:MAG: ATP-binding protein [Candidatus Hermodarchaeota archaeon]
MELKGAVDCYIVALLRKMMPEEIEYHRIDDYLIKCFKKKISAFIHGPPGIGKSAAVQRVAQKLSIDYIDMRLTQMDAVDLRGLPVLAEEGTLTAWAPPEELPREGTGILFLDELNLAPPSVQHAAYQLILQRRLGKYYLPQEWVCFAAGNRVEDRAHVNELPSPLANRFVHINMNTPPIDQWINWALENDIDERIMGFLKWRPEMLFEFNPDNPSTAFPTPRSWEFCSRLIQEEMDLKVMRDYATMSVGKRAASELAAFIEIFSQIDAEAILNDSKYQFPENLGELTATIIALSVHVKKASENLQLKYLELLAGDGLQAEYSVLGVQLAFSRAQLVSLFERPKASNSKLVQKLLQKLEGFINWE